MNWLKRMVMPLKRALDEWLRDEETIGETEQESTETSEVLPSSPQSPTQIDRNPGINCPQCSHKFPVSIEILLSLQPIYCPSCNLKLELNEEKSKEALEAMEKVWRAVNQSEK